MWNHFTVTASDSKYATCNICNSKISRGLHNPKLQSLRRLSSHLRSWHPQLTLKNLLTEKAILTTTDNPENIPTSDQLEPLTIKKRTIPLFDIRSKWQRTEMLQFTMPGWFDNISKVDSNSEEGLKFHRSIFEMIILDLQPWSIVNNPGFLRHHAVFTPHFDIRS